MISVYVAPEGETDWGENLLDTAIPPGGSGDITDLPKAVVNIKTVFDAPVPFENVRTEDLRYVSKLNITLTLE